MNCPYVSSRFNWLVRIRFEFSKTLKLFKKFRSFWTQFPCYLCVFDLFCKHKCNNSTSVILESSQISKMEPFVKMVNGFQLLFILTKSSILDVWLGSQCGSEFPIFSPFSYSATGGPFFHFNLNQWILMSLLIRYTHSPSVSKQIFRNILIV